MSSKKYDNYTTFAGYNTPKTTQSGPYKTYESYTNKEIKKQELPPQHPEYQSSQPQKQPQQPQQPQSFVRGNQGPIPPQKGQQQPQQQPQQQSRVRSIEPGKLHNIITNPQFATAKNGKPAKIIVKVHTSWCEPCKQIAPKFEEIANNPNYGEVLFLEVDGDQLGPELSKVLNVSAVPTFNGYVGGKLVGVVHGPNVADIYSLCDKISTA